MRVLLDISPYWPRDEKGEPRSINSVHKELEGTEHEVGRNTLRLALEGTLDRGLYASLVKLSKACSQWKGEEVDVKDLLKVVDEDSDK